MDSNACCLPTTGLLTTFSLFPSTTPPRSPTSHLSSGLLPASACCISGFVGCACSPLPFTFSPTPFTLFPVAFFYYSGSLYTLDDRLWFLFFVLLRVSFSYACLLYACVLCVHFVFLLCVFVVFLYRLTTVLYNNMPFMLCSCIAYFVPFLPPTPHPFVLRISSPSNSFYIVCIVVI